jgi:hypothetical protein
VFAKLAVLILTIGAVAATLLAARQQRLYAVHESAEAMRRIVEHDRTLWRLRGEIAERVMPGKVKQMADRLGTMAYFFQERSSNLAAGPGADQGVRPASRDSEKPRPELEAVVPTDENDLNDEFEQEEQ